MREFEELVGNRCVGPVAQGAKAGLVHARVAVGNRREHGRQHGAVAEAAGQRQQLRRVARGSDRRHDRDGAFLRLFDLDHDPHDRTFGGVALGPGLGGEHAGDQPW